MGIGTSKGAFYEDEFHKAVEDWNNFDSSMVVSPDKYQADKRINSDPNNIYDDQGDIVDYQETIPITPVPPE